MSDYSQYRHFDYLIIGSGMTADAAVQGIREIDQQGTIGVIGAEPHAPYDRPPLSKGLWKDKPLESIWRKSAPAEAELIVGRTVRELDPEAHRVVDDQESGYRYQKLLLATGGAPRRLPFGGDDIIYYRTVQDYYRLRSLTDDCKQFAVIGGGFIGSEIAAALAMNGKSVTLAFPEEGIGARIYPKDLSLFLNQFFRDKGTEVRAGEMVSGMEREGDRFSLAVKSGHPLEADGVVAGIGIDPRVELAQAADLSVDDGIVVDEFLRTGRPDIYAAGDVANFYNPALDRRLRVEHEDNANTMGRMAGRTMAGAAAPYHHLPFFYSDLFELGYEAVGELDSRLETFSDWKEPYREGVIYYLRDGRVRGVLLWNTWGQVDAARRLIAEPGPFRAADLKGRLPAR